MNPISRSGYEQLPGHDSIPIQYKQQRIWGFESNLDLFLRDVYIFHQRGGFAVLALDEILLILKFVFIVFIGVELSVCTRWQVLSNPLAPVHGWDDVFVPPGTCWSSLPLFPALLVCVAFFALLGQSIRALARLNRFWYVSQFYRLVLDLPTSDKELSDITWYEVQRRIIEKQKEVPLQTDKPQLDELDIYHRILRIDNYMIGLVNRSALPIRFPFLCPNEHYVYFPDGLLFNLKLLLFWTPWSPFQSQSKLRTEFRWITKRHELANELITQARILGIVNLILSPVIIFAQLLVFVCSNAEKLRYQPNTIFGRRWSNFARLYLRHFNELDHEMATRLRKAYIPASRYLDSFVSRPLTTLADAGVFLFGGTSVAFFFVGLLREQFMHLAGYWLIVVAGGILARACLAIIPDENIVYVPRNLLLATLAQIHYMPDHWKVNAGTHKVCNEISRLFPYRLSGALEEFLSPILTPIFLIVIFPNYALNIVDFLRNFTVAAPGAGDVCSFAQLDVRRHGDPSWKPDNDEFVGSSTHMEPTGGSAGGGMADEETLLLSRNYSTSASIQNIAFDGKTELSLMHFHLNNPQWSLPPDGRNYLESVRHQALKDLRQSRQLSPAINSAMISQREPTATGIPLCLFSSLYKGQPEENNAHLVESGTGPHNRSQISGPGYVANNALGIVGALSESITSAANDTSTTSTQRGQLSTSNLTTSVHVTPDDQTILDTTFRPEVSPSTDQDANKIPGSSRAIDASSDHPNLPTTSSMMHGSLFFSNDPTNLPSYYPYVSQTDDMMFQQLGARSGMLGDNHEVSVADMKLSCLYLHELHHRRESRDQSEVRHRDQTRQFMASSSIFPRDSMPMFLSGTDSVASQGNVPRQTTVFPPVYRPFRPPVHQAEESHRQTKFAFAQPDDSSIRPVHQPLSPRLTSPRPNDSPIGRHQEALNIDESGGGGTATGAGVFQIRDPTPAASSSSNLPRQPVTACSSDNDEERDSVRMWPNLPPAD